MGNIFRRFCVLSAVAAIVMSCDPTSGKGGLAENLSDVRRTAEDIENVAKAVHDLAESVDEYTSDNKNDASETQTTEVLLPAPMNKGKEQILYRTGYVTSYNRDNRIPNWVAWRLTKAHTYGNVSREDMKFEEDREVPSPRAAYWDYYNTGYDRGHMCPAADNKWSQKAMQESFLMTNICPQNTVLNAGDWNELEIQCRKWARRYGSINIVCGPILYKGAHKRIGKSKVVVPEAFFKVVMREGKNPKAIAFIYKNREGNRPKGDYVNTVDQLERITGMDFFSSLPDDVEQKMEAEAELSDWGL